MQHKQQTPNLLPDLLYSAVLLFLFHALHYISYLVSLEGGQELSVPLLFTRRLHTFTFLSYFTFSTHIESLAFCIL